MMAQHIVTDAVQPCPTIGGSCVWTPADTLPGAIGPSEPDIRFLTLADLPPDRLRIADVEPDAAWMRRLAYAGFMVARTEDGVRAAARNLRIARQTLWEMAR